jgi:hypothetical protein
MSAAATLGSTFEILVKNIGAGTLTITPNGAETIDGGATATLLTGQSALVSSNGTALRTFKGAGGTTGRGYLYGLTLSNDGGSPNTVIDIATGEAASDDTTPTLMALASAYTKTTGAWAVGTGNGGLDTGSVANNTWYHVFLIKRPDTGVVDVLLSTSATAPTMPANYTLKRRIGSLKTNGSAQIIAFTQKGNNFYWAAAVTDRSSTSALAETLLTLTVPIGISVQPICQNQLKSNTSSQAANTFRNADASDAGSRFIQSELNVAQTVYLFGGFYTNTSGQIRFSSLIFSGTLVSNDLFTNGWIDNRGGI